MKNIPIPTPPADLRERIAALAWACQETLTPGPSPRGEGGKASVGGGGLGMKAPSANAQRLSEGEPGVSISPPLPQGEGPGVRALEAELNALVYQAYGLDADDIRVIESAVGGESGVESSMNDDDRESDGEADR